jgi:hypothetical protein
MKSGSNLALQCFRVSLILAMCQNAMVFGQQGARPKSTVVAVPTVGCKLRGQLEDTDGPAAGRIPLPISSKAAQRLSYYQDMNGFGVLAPRGWYCFGFSGSGSGQLFLSPTPIDADTVFKDEGGFYGPAIEVNVEFGPSSRPDAAEVVARVFPAYKEFVTSIITSFELPAGSIIFSPYPDDKLTYRSKREVWYETPSQTAGLGTHSQLRMNSGPIHGLAMLLGETPDLLLLSVRLAPDQADLIPTIIRELERQEVRRKPN